MEEENKKAAEEKKVEAEGKDAAGKKAEEGVDSQKKEENKKNKTKKKKKGSTGKKKDAGKKDVQGDAAEGGSREGDGENKETPPPPPPPEEIVMRVFMHCEGCARKVQRCLAGFPGVEEVKTDSRAQMVVVKGKTAAADPLRVVERLQRKSGRKVELLSPIPPKPEEQKKEEKGEEAAEKPKPEDEKKEEPQPPTIEVVLKVRMHCDACAQEIKRRILKMKGVQSAEPDLKASEVTVKGEFDAAALVEHVHRRTGRHATVVKTERSKAPPVKEEAGGQDKAAGGGEAAKAPKAVQAAGGEAENPKEEKGGDGGGVATEKEAVAAGNGGEVTKNPYCHYYPRYQVEYAYPPQIFSDENPNACSVM